MKLKELICMSENIDIDKYIEFREYVKSNMENPDWLGDFSKVDLINLVNNKSKIWVYYFNNEPVCSMMIIPADEKSLSELDLNLNYKDVIQYGPIFVNPKYVGKGLQYQMFLKLDEYCYELGYKYAVATVHPDNIYSINNFIKDKFILFNTKEFKRGIRDIYLRVFDRDYDEKILTFIVNKDKLLLLKGSDTDPQFHESFWYTVTGSVEKIDNNLEDAVKREIKEETNLETKKIKKIPIVFEYESLGTNCVEHGFISYVEDGIIILNEENIDYKWCNIDEFVKLIKWYDDKNKLLEILKNNITNINKN